MNRQRGAAMMVILTVLVLGVAWFAVGALGKVAVSTADREAKTALALQAAKKALLGHVAQYAGRTTFDFPGRMPCPESLNAYGTANEGQSPGACSNTVAVVGRLPWQTLGIDQLRDADGEALWYVLGPNFHPTAFPLNPAPPNPYLNFGTPAALPFDGTNVVALVIAPGRALQSNPCNAVNQQAARFAVPLNPAKFFECGNATGAYTNPGTSAGSNDRVLAITQAEWADAIAGPVADRLQRQVLPVLADWHTVEFAATEASLGVGNGRSWGSAPPAGWNLPYLPFASSWSNPTTDDYCGNQDAYEGLAPVDPTCYRSPWTGTSTATGGLNVLGGGACIDLNGTHLRCRYQRLLGLGALTARITAQAANVGRAFRGTIRASEIVISGNGSVTNMTMSIPNNTSDATAVIDVTWPGILGLLQVVTVDVPHLQDAAVLSDARIAWFLNNQWQRYTYYAVAPGATVSAPTNCANPAYTGCLTVTGLPASAGPANRKRLLLMLSGRALAGETQPSANRNDYFESPNDATNIAGGASTFASGTVTATFNDRIATCPYAYIDGGGNNVSLCN